MATQELQWLAVPYDVEQRDGRTYLSVAISVTPKLQEATTQPRTLADYPDWIDWPETLKNIKIALDFDGLKVKPSAMVRYSTEDRDDQDCSQGYEVKLWWSCRTPKGDGPHEGSHTE
ncbi:MAG: hypothetical protein IPH49_05270 [Ignavibacteria bacterium]|nr:hypothetical protein [Ignavibacteria bacterium]